MFRNYKKSLLISRGMIYAALFGIAGAIGPVVIVIVIRESQAYLGVSTNPDSHTSWLELKGQLVKMMITSGTVFGCVGWATFAPLGKWPFTRTLLYVFIPSLLFWAEISFMGLLSHQKKENKSDLRDFVLLLPPPILISLTITMLRAKLISTNHSLPPCASGSELQRDPE